MIIGWLHMYSFWLLRFDASKLDRQYPQIDVVSNSLNGETCVLSPREKFRPDKEQPQRRHTPNVSA